MADVRVLLALAALCAFALLFVSFGIKAALAPFFACCTAILWFTLCGMAGFLRLGGWIFYLAALSAAGFLVWRHGIQKKALPKLGFGFWFFAVGSLVLILLLWVKQPLFLYWDEFSFWGTAGKVVKLSDQLYTTTRVGWATISTQKPGLIMLSYFFQFFGKGFAEWQTYAAYDVFMLAGLATVLVAFEKRSQWPVALPAMIVLFLIPFVFRHGIPPTMISNVYTDSTAELPLATTFGGILATWYGGERRRLRGMVPVCCALATLVLLKDAALMFALVAAVLVFTDALLDKRGNRPALRARALPTLARLGLGLAAVAAAFILWEVYASALVGSRVADVGGSSGAGMLQLPGLFLRDLFSAQKTQVFLSVTTNMVGYFFARSTMFGSGFVVVAGIWAMLALAGWLAPKKSPQRRQCLTFGVFSTLGFAAYYFFILLSYLYILAESEALLLASYDRYIYPFYMGWFMAALFFLARSAAGNPARRTVLGKAAVWLLSVAVLWRCGQMLHPGYTLLGVNAQDYNEAREFKTHTALLAEHLDEDDKLFIVLSEDGGLGIYKYVHELLPIQADYSYGGGAQLREKRPGAQGEREIVEISAQELADHLRQNGCTKLYIDTANARFAELYGELFADGMESWENRQTVLYRVVPTGDGVRLVPLDVPPW